VMVSSLREAMLFLSMALLATCLAGCAGMENEDPWNEVGPDGERIPTPKTLMVTARILAKRGNSAQAERVLEHLAELHPNYVPAYNELAMLHLRDEDPGAARRALERGLQVAPEDSVIMNNLGVLSLMEARYEEAAEQFETLAETLPRDGVVECNLALSLGLLGEIESAKNHYRNHLTIEKTRNNLDVIERARQSLGERQSAPPFPASSAGETVFLGDS